MARILITGGLMLACTLFGCAESRGSRSENAVAVKDEVDRWIELLKSEVLHERECATERLSELPAEAIPRLEAVRNSTDTPEVRARLGVVLETLRDRMEFARYLPPTKRITYVIQDRALEDALTDLGARLGLRLRAGRDFERGPLDISRRVSLELRDVTGWEALDALARVAAARYDSEDVNLDSPVEFRPDEAPRFPAFYHEQFRIGIGRAHLEKTMGPGDRILDVIGLRVGLSCQWDAVPALLRGHAALAIDAVKDSQGRDPRRSKPDDFPVKTNSDASGLSSWIFLGADTVFPVDIHGTVAVPFPLRVAPVSIRLVNGRGEAHEGPVRFSASIESEPDGSRALHVLAQDPSDRYLVSRLLGEEIELGSRPAPSQRFSVSGTTLATRGAQWTFSLPSDPPAGTEILLAWIAEFRWVRFPFALRSVPRP